MRVGDRGFGAAAAIAGRPRHRARTARADPQHAAVVDPHQRTAAGADAQIALLRGLAPLDEVDAAAGEALLANQLALPFAGTGSVFGVGVRPTDLAPLLDAVALVGGTFAGRAALVAGDVLLPDEDPDRSSRLIAAVRGLGGTVQARRGADAHRLATHAHAPGIAELEAAMREQLDPAGVLA